ncbi:MAG: transposase [Ktedonobacterales bacterium]|nr:transposase [Ktedonobacterales bacterium]
MRHAADGGSVKRTRGDRSAAIVERLLGEGFSGTLVSDCYVGYAPYVGVKQQCWAGRPLGSMLRDVHDLGEAHPRDAAVQAWAAGVQDV